MPNRTPIRGSIKRAPLKRTPVRAAKRRKADSDDEEIPAENESLDLKLASSDDESDKEANNSSPEAKPKINPEWNKVIMDEYAKASRLFNKEILTVGVPKYEQSRKEAGTTRYRVQGKSPLPFNLKPLKPKDNRPTGDLRSYNNAVIQKCPLFTLEDAMPTPVMQYWTHTEVNLVADDEKTLSHIPFLGDGDEDVGWCDELLEVFEEGIHGTKFGCSAYINDFILYHVIKNAQEKLKPPTLNKKKELDWFRKFYQHVYELFPNKLSAQLIEFTWADLVERFDENFIPQSDIVDEQGELIANFAPSTLLNSFEALICPKCFAYDCLFHSSNQDYNLRSFSNIKTRHQKSKKSPNDKPVCSPSCHLHLLKSRGSFSSASGSNPLASPKTPKSSTASGSKASKLLDKELTVQILDEDNWSPHEEAMFSLLRTVPGAEDDYCGIAKLLRQLSKRRPKSCLEVFQYAQRTAPMSPRLELPTSPKKKKKNPNDKHRKFRAAKWNESSGKVLNVNVYRPCNHAGECSKEVCECVKAENPCTKFCACSEDCKIRFPGCRCAPGNCRTKQCQCYYASFECDPDICKSCNCDKPEDSTEPICKNVSIQRGLQKRLVVAPSEVAGWGCYAYEDIEKNDFISEYTGEVVSQMEGERRGKIYDKIKCSYLFRLNNEQSVDATRKGNIIRFANHSKHPNCRAKVVVVNGDHKIGIFALQNIKAGEELFFDYAYDRRQQIEFVPKERASTKGVG